jgi:hypothetical protein
MFEAGEGGEGVIQDGVFRFAGKVRDEADSA